MRINFLFARQGILLPLLLAVIVTLILLPLSFGSGIADVLDFSNHLAGIVEAKLALAQGQVFLRTAPLEQSGWGYAYYQFYSESAYAFAAIVYQLLTPSNPVHAYWLTIWLSLWMGSIYIYRLADWFLKSRAAAVMASVVYLASPYFLVVIYQQNDFTEAVALGILPAVLYYSLRQYQYLNDNKNLLQTALAWYLLATTHLISFFYTSVFVALMLILITLKDFRRCKNLLRVGVAYFFGCVLALWFLAPVLLYKKYLKVETLYGNIKIFSAYKTSMAVLFFPWLLVPGRPNIGLPVLFALFICVYAFLRKSRLEDEAANHYLPVLLFLFFLITMMVWSPVNFWQYLPKIFLTAQYSWRLLAQLVWIGPLLFAWAICWLYKNKLNAYHAIFGIILILLASSCWLKIPEKNSLSPGLADLLETPRLLFNPESYMVNNKKMHNLLQDNLIPASQKSDPRQTQRYCQREGVSTVCALKNFPPVKLLELPILYYPDLLHITVNGKTVEYGGVLYQGRVVAAILSRPGVNIIKMQFRGLVWANCISVLAWGLWFLILLFGMARLIKGRDYPGMEKSL